MTLERLWTFMITLMCFHSLRIVIGSIIKSIDWNGEERYKKDLERGKRQLESSTKYLDDVYTVKLFCEFIIKINIELLNKILKEDYKLSDEFIEDFKSKYYYYIKIRRVSYLINDWNMTQYGKPLTDRYGNLNIDIDEVLENIKIKEVYNGYSLEDFEVDKLANGNQKIIDLLNNIEEELIDDAIERKERNEEYYYKLKSKR